MLAKTINVVVTGGAPLPGHHINVSAVIRDRLPDQIIRTGKPPISISKYPQDIDCRYDSVIAKMEHLWSGERSIYETTSSFPGQKNLPVDLALHMGMDRGRTHYSIDGKARRNGYEKPGRDGLYLQEGVFKGLPEQLESMFDLRAVAASLKSKLPSSVKIEPSLHAGRFFCAFQLFSSLAVLHRKSEPQRVAFLHIPVTKDEEDIERSVQVAEAVIRELVGILESESTEQQERG